MFGGETDTSDFQPRRDQMILDLNLSKLVTLSSSIQVKSNKDQNLLKRDVPLLEINTIHNI